MRELAGSFVTFSCRRLWCLCLYIYVTILEASRAFWMVPEHSGSHMSNLPVLIQISSLSQQVCSLDKYLWVKALTVPIALCRIVTAGAGSSTNTYR